MRRKPILFLDFDRTLFDTEQFYEWLGDDRFARLLDVTAGKIPPPDFSAMLYSDTLPFLQKAKKTHRLVLLTYAVNTVLQRRKVRGSGLTPFFADIIITSRGKGLEAKKYLEHTEANEETHGARWEHVFIDDAPQNIDDMKKVNPGIKSIRIDRTPLSYLEFIGVTEQPDLVVGSLEALMSVLFEKT